MSDYVMLTVSASGSSLWTSITPGQKDGSSLLAKVGETIQKLQKDIERDKQMLNGHGASAVKPSGIERYLSGTIAEKYKSTATAKVEKYKASAKAVIEARVKAKSGAVPSEKYKASSKTSNLSYKPTPIVELKRKKKPEDDEYDPFNASIPIRKRSEKEMEIPVEEEEYEPSPTPATVEYKPTPKKKARLEETSEESLDEEPLGAFSDDDNDDHDHDPDDANDEGASSKAVAAEKEKKQSRKPLKQPKSKEKVPDDPNDLVSQIMQDSSKSLNLTGVRHKPDGSMVILSEKKPKKPKFDLKEKPTVESLCLELSDDDDDDDEDNTILDDPLEAPQAVDEPKPEPTPEPEPLPSKEEIELARTKQQVLAKIASGSIVLGHIARDDESRDSNKSDKDRYREKSKHSGVENLVKSDKDKNRKSSSGRHSKHEKAKHQDKSSGNRSRGHGSDHHRDRSSSGKGTHKKSVDTSIVTGRISSREKCDQSEKKLSVDLKRIAEGGRSVETKVESPSLARRDSLPNDSHKYDRTTSEIRSSLDSGNHEHSASKSHSHLQASKHGHSRTKDHSLRGSSTDSQRSSSKSRSGSHSKSSRSSSQKLSDHRHSSGSNTHGKSSASKHSSSSGKSSDRHSHHGSSGGKHDNASSHRKSQSSLSSSSHLEPKRTDSQPRDSRPSVEVKHTGRSQSGDHRSLWESLGQVMASSDKQTSSSSSSLNRSRSLIEEKKPAVLGNLFGDDSDSDSIILISDSYDSSPEKKNRPKNKPGSSQQACGDNLNDSRELADGVDWDDDPFEECYRIFNEDEAVNSRSRTVSNQ